MAAGFSPLALGTETIGSIITPATRAGLYALKPTVGVQDTRGLYTLTDFFDSPGPMAKCAQDVLLLTEVLLGRSFSRDGLGSWEGLSVGFLDPNVWKMSEEICRQHDGTAGQMVGPFFKADGCYLTLFAIATRIRGSHLQSQAVERGCQVSHQPRRRVRADNRR